MADSVLLIDDDESVRRSVGDYFERIGYEVYRAPTGESGGETFERVRPDVVILDLQLPGSDGLDVLERLRSRGGSVIVLTHQGDSGTAVRAMQLGAENVLLKPVDVTHLAAATARVSEKVRLSRQNALLRAKLEEAMVLPDGSNQRRHQPTSLADVERQHIERTLRFHGGNRTRAAQELGISRATLINKIKAYSLNI